MIGRQPGAPRGAAGSHPGSTNRGGHVDAAQSSYEPPPSSDTRAGDTPNSIHFTFVLLAQTHEVMLLTKPPLSVLTKTWFADAVTASGGKIHVQASLGDSGVEVCIEDDGGGIEPSVRDRLFEPFVTTKEVGKGTGLGLAVCRGLIEAAGGTIDAEEGEAGARFVLRLPRA